MAFSSGWRGCCRLVQHRWTVRKASEAAGELEIPEDSGRRWVKPADPDTGRSMHVLSRTERKGAGEAGATGPSAEPGAGDRGRSHGPGVRGVQRTDGSDSGGNRGSCRGRWLRTQRCDADPSPWPAQD